LAGQSKRASPPNRSSPSSPSTNTFTGCRCTGRSTSTAKWGAASPLPARRTGGWEQIRPLWELLRLVVFSQKYLQADESPIKVLDRDHKNGIHKGYMW